MARFLCDFDVLDKQVKSLKSVASEMKSEVATYKNKISEDLIGWDGIAKTELFERINNRTPRVEDMAKTIEDLSDFITKETNNIKNLEEKLAAFNI